MKEAVRYGLTLAVICMVASGLLSLVNSVTRPRIITQAIAQEESVLKELLPAAAGFRAVKSGDQTLYYSGYDQKNRFVGAVFKASGKGYSSVIETMVGLTPEGKVTAIKVVSQNDTPGLGSRISEPDFTNRFADKSTQDLSQVQAITGATISSSAVINSVSKKATEIMELIKDEE